MILSAAQAQVRHRLARMRAYRDIEVSEADIHLWQQRNPVVTEHHAEVRAPWLTVRLPASTRVRLTLTLALRTRPPLYATPFDGILGPQASPGKSNSVPGRWCHGPFGIGLFIRTDLGASPGAGSDAPAGEASRSAGQGHG
jgi:hypothetical protein